MTVEDTWSEMNWPFFVSAFSVRLSKISRGFAACSAGALQKKIPPATQANKLHKENFQILDLNDTLENQIEHGY